MHSFEVGFVFVGRRFMWTMETGVLNKLWHSKYLLALPAPQKVVVQEAVLQSLQHFQRGVKKKPQPVKLAQTLISGVLACLVVSLPPACAASLRLLCNLFYSHKAS